MNPKHIIIALVLSFAYRTISGSCSTEVLNLNGYTCEKDIPIGQGAGGTAYLIKKNDTVYVMKVQSVNERSTRELEILKEVGQIPYVVKLIDNVKKFDKYYFVITYGSKGSLLDFLDQNNYFKDTSNIYSFFRKLLEGLKGIHKKGYIHADLKLENVVVNHENEPMIIDFDMAVEKGKRFPPRGTLQYMPPEVLKEFQLSNFLDYNESMDLYSFSIMMYAVYYERFPLGLTSINYILLMNLTITMDSGTPENLFDMVFGGIKTASVRISNSDMEDKLVASSLINTSVTIPATVKYTLNEYASDEEKAIGIPKIQMYIYGFLVALVLLIVGCSFGCYFCCCQNKRAQHHYHENSQNIYS